MAEAIVSAVLEQLTSLISQEIKKEVKLVVGVEEEVEVLANNFRAMQAVLVDAEQRQVKEETVRIWLDQLKAVSYDMEDVLDEWNTARLKLQIEGVDNAIAPKKKVSSILTSPCFCFKRVSLRRDIAHKIKEINENLDVIAKEKNDFNFSLSVDEKSKRVPSISFVDESKICGRDDEKNKLIKKLCETSEKQKGFHVISIVGMGGIGKTTLAQLASNEDQVKKHFHEVIWVYVSDSFDEFRIAKAIIEALNGHASHLSEFQSLMQLIHNSIEGKKILLVLDDVWNDDYKKWEPFHNCLQNSFHGSKILITTRKESVAQMMGSVDVISITQLTDEACWSLFKLIAFSGRSNQECQKLEGIGRKIVGKCKGLPLAAKTIGSLMRSKKTKEEWQRILDSELWKLEESEELGLLAPLLLSYNDLPSMVKRCFSYCAVLPKDYSIEKDELIKLWMAHGYISVKQNKEMEMEMIGQEYFDILATRSFFQEFERDYDDFIIKCKMHDIVHDFAKFISKGECLAIDELNGLEELILPERNVFHSLLKLSEKFPFPSSISRFKRLRSLLIRGAFQDYSLVSKVLPELFDNLTSLRVFHMDIDWYWFVSTIQLPKEVGKLIHLRYLNLSGQPIEGLPETLCELYNLQILDISNCKRLKELPQGIGKLTNMRHLLNDFTRSITYLPVGITRLTNLRTLRRFIVGGNVDEIKKRSLESLKNFDLLRDCGIVGLGNVSDVGEANISELDKRKNLHVLRLRFDRSNEGRRKNEEDEELLEALQPPLNLKELLIIEYRGNSFFPSWMTSLTNLKVLNLVACMNCVHLPPLGKLPSLERLQLFGMKSVKRVGNEFLGIDQESSSYVVAFPKLKSLEFLLMRNWEEWDYGINGNGENCMPLLSSLTIEDCLKLKALPSHILQKTTLQKLEIRETPSAQTFQKGIRWVDLGVLTDMLVEHPAKANQTFGFPQRKYKTNSEYRSKLSSNHRARSKSFHAHRTRSFQEKQVEEEQLSFEEGSRPISDEEMSHQVFGDQSHHYRGLAKCGQARDVDRDSISNNVDLRSELESTQFQLQLTKSRLQSTENELQTYKDRLITTEDQLFNMGTTLNQFRDILIELAPHRFPYSKS